MDGINEASFIGRVLTIWDAIEQNWPWQISWRNLSYLAFFHHIIRVQSKHPRTRWLNHCTTASLVIWWSLSALINHLEEQGKPVTLYRGVVAAAGVYVVTKLAQMAILETVPAETTDGYQVQHGQHTGLKPSNLEADLEHAFKAYLRHLVETSPRDIRLRYLPARGAPDVFHSVLSSGGGPDITMDVLTPVFYTRFCCYAHDSEGIFSEITEGTMRVDRPDRLPDIFLRQGSPPLHARGVIDYAAFEIIRRLRRRPQSLGSQPAPVDPRYSILDVRSFRISSMDAFILSQDDEELRRTYRYSLLELLIANGLFGGSEAVIQVCALALRLVWCWAIARAISNYTSYLTYEYPANSKAA